MQIEEKRKRLSEAGYFYLRQDIRGTQIFLYGIAGVGFFLALRRVRPFARFVKPSDIPDHFIKSKVKICADVIRIEPSEAGPLLMVETKPVVSLPRFGISKQLPITIANVDVIANGTSWLQSVVSGKKIVFVPLAKNKDNVDCRILLLQQNEACLEIGKELVQLGFGMVRKVDPNRGSSKDKEVLTYLESLIAAQKWAERQRNGYWHYAIEPTLSWRLKNILSTKAKSVLRAVFTRQLNI